MYLQYWKIIFITSFDRLFLPQIWYMPKTFKSVLTKINFLKTPGMPFLVITTYVPSISP